MRSDEGGTSRSRPLGDTDASASALKVRYIFLPLLALAAVVVAGYSVLNWLLVARSGLVPLDEDVAGYWLPLVVSSILVLALIQPALALLKSDRKGSLPILYYFAAVAMVAGPTVIAQKYVQKETGDITRVRFLGDVASRPASKYYTVDEICITPGKALIEPVVRTRGPNNKTLNFDEYAVVPACDQGAAAPGRPSIWIGRSFHDSLSNSLGRSEKEAEYAAFLRRSAAVLRDEDPRTFRYFERVGRTADRKGFAAALRQAGVNIESPSSIVLVPHKEAFEQRAAGWLAWTLGSFVTGAILWLGVVLLSPLQQAKVAHWRDRSGADGNPYAVNARDFLVPNQRNYGLALLLDANVLVFTAMVLAGLGCASFDTQDLLKWGANYRPALQGLGLFRLVTSEFVHSGPMHLTINMFGLVYAAMFLLPAIGNMRLIVGYLLSGLGGSIASAAAHPATVSVGSSGAVYGLFGILLTLILLRDKRVADVEPLGWILAILTGIILFLGAISPGTDLPGHLGGLATGAVLGLGIFFVKPRCLPSRRTTRIE